MKELSISSILTTETPLTKEEKEVAEDDINGIAPITLENDDMIQEALFQFELRLNQTHPKPAYELAFSQNPQYVQNYKFRLMFLRATDFHVPKAVEKFVVFFEEKLKMFGLEALSRSLKLSDLEKEELFGLKAGWLQVLPFRDSAGRAVLWKTPVKDYGKLDIQAKIKKSFYQILSMLENDEETQKSGIAFIIYGLEEPVNASTTSPPLILYETAWMGAKTLEYLPMRVSSIHFCVPHLGLPTKMLSMFLSGISRAAQARIRIHQGSDTEWMYALMTYGIPIKYAPVTYDGSIKTKAMQQWINRRKQLEAAPPNTTFIELPGQFDVLIGKGMPLQSHFGNIRYHEIIDSKRDEYMKAGPKVKKAMAKQTLEEIQQQTGLIKCVRFLERKTEGGWWTEITDQSVLLRKVTKRFTSRQATSKHINPAAKPPLPPTPYDKPDDNNLPPTKFQKIKYSGTTGIMLNQDYDQQDTSDSACFGFGCFNSIEDGQQMRITDW